MRASGTPDAKRRWVCHRQWNDRTPSSSAGSTPNWHLRLPGFGYDEDDPEGFLTRDEVVSHLEDYAASFDPPLRHGVTVTGVEPDEDSGRYRVRTGDRTYDAAHVVIAAGAPVSRQGQPRLGRQARHRRRVGG